MLDEKRKQGHKIHFVPTMGALHDGHISLLKQASQKNAVVVCSIFVNPTQFNDKADLDKYPRTLEADLALIEAGSDCRIVFAPDSPNEVYDQTYQEQTLGLEGLDKVMEGAFRPGHFKGVVNVVNQLFAIVKPDVTFFGEKDFQQLAIIRLMTKKLNLDIDIVGCPIIREPNGLARSSRNERLSVKMRAEAALIHQSLQELKSNYLKYSLETCKTHFMRSFENSPLEVEYLSIVDGHTLQEISEWHETAYAQACTAVFAGEIRLIDNVQIFA